MNHPKRAASGDHFTQFYDFQRHALAGRPGWWRFILEVFTRRRDFRTAIAETSYGGLAHALAAEGVEVHRNSIRYAVDQLEALGLIVRDRAANIDARRLVVRVKTSVKQTSTELKEAIRQAMARRLAGAFGRPSHREKLAAIGRSIRQRYQMTPSESVIQEKKGCPQPEITDAGHAKGVADARALLARIKTQPAQ